MSDLIISNLSSPEARGKRIRYLREHVLCLTREEFCNGTTITSQSLKGWELAWGGGVSNMGVAKIINRTKELNVYCTEAWIMHGIGREATQIKKDFNLNKDDEHIAKELLVFRELPNSIDAIIKDDGMTPLLYPGNYVGGIIINEIESAFGKECIVVSDNNEILIRILLPGSEPSRYNLVCLNKDPVLAKKEIKNTNVKLVAPILWIRRAYQEND